MMPFTQREWLSFVFLTWTSPCPFVSLSPFIGGNDAYLYYRVRAAFTWSYTVLLMTLLITGLILADILLYTFEKMGGYTFISYISRTHAQGLSLINLSYPEMFFSSNVKEIVAAASTVLASTLPEDNDDGFDDSDLGYDENGNSSDPTLLLTGTRAVTFDLDVAKTCLMLSALVYERIEAKVSAASSVPRWCEERLLASESKIHVIAARFGLRFASVSDFTRWVSLSFHILHPPSSTPLFSLAWLA